MLRSSLLASIAVGALASAPACLAAETHQAVNPGAIKWEPAPAGLPKGAMASVLAGDPSKSEFYILRVKVPDGYTIPPHWHSQAENVTVLSGTLHVGDGDKLDKTKGEALTAGGFFSMPAQMRHFAWSTGESTIQIGGMGPFDIHYVNPADDPRTATTGAR